MRFQGVRGLAAVIATVAILSTACAQGQEPPATTATAAPTSSAQTPSAAAPSLAAGTCRNFVEVVETGPEPPDAGENGPVPQNQQRLSNDIEAAIAYGAEHPDEFASVRFENAPRVRIVIGFADHIDAHCAALRGLFEYPDEFEIIQQPRTAQQAEHIQQDVVAIAGSSLRAAGMGAETVWVSLRADAEPLAEEIRARYGDLVTITLGVQGYPAGTAPDPDCAARPMPLVTASPYVATLRLENATVRSGEDFSGTATVTNRSDVPVEFESGQPMTAFIYRAGTDQLVGVYDGGIGGTGIGKTMAPGESIDIDVVGGTASCVADLGYALPPGVYDVRTAIDQYDRTQPEMVVRYLLSAPATLTVTP